MRRNLRRVFNSSRRVRRKGCPAYMTLRSPYSRAKEFAKWLEEHTDATHVEVNQTTRDEYEVSWLEPMKKIR